MIEGMGKIAAVLISLSLLTIGLFMVPSPIQASNPLTFKSSPEEGQAGRFYQYVPDFNKEANIIGHWTNAPFLSWDGDGFVGTPDLDQYGRFILSIYAQSEDGQETVNQNRTVEFDTHWVKEELVDVPNIISMSLTVGDDGAIHASYVNSTGILKHMSWSDGWRQPFSLLGVTGEDEVLQSRIAVDSQGLPHIVFRNSSGLWYMEKNNPIDHASSWDLIPEPLGTFGTIGHIDSMLLDSDDKAHILVERNDDNIYLKRSDRWTYSFVESFTVSYMEGVDFALMPDDSARFVYTTSTDPMKKVYYAELDIHGNLVSTLVFESPYMLFRPKIEIFESTPHITFQQNQSSQVKVHYGFLDGSDWTFEIVLGPDEGNLKDPNLQLDEQGNASVVFVRTSIPDAVFHSYRDEGVWMHEVIESRQTSYGHFCDYVLDGDGKPHAFYSRDGLVIHAHPGQWAPTFLNSPEDVYVGELFEYIPQFNEPAEIVARSTNAPFLTWDEIAAGYHGTPAEEEAGTYWINLTAVASYGGLSSTIKKTFTVKPLYSPILTPVPDFSSHEGQVGEPYHYRIGADGPVEWSWSSDLMFTVEWESSISLQLHLIPDVSGSFDVNITGKSINGLLKSYENFTLTIFPRWAPQITSTPLTTVQEASQYSYNIVVNETEVSWADLETDAGFLSFSAANQTIYGTPQIGDAGTYYVNISVSSDAGKESTHQNYTLIVGEAWAPQIESDLDRVTVQATTIAHRTLEANESVTWSIDHDLDFISFDEVESILEFSPDKVHVGDHHIHVTATSIEGKLSSTVRINITVTGIWHPTLTVGPEWNGKEVFAYEQTVTANESVTWSYTDNLPSSLDVITDATQLVISGTPEVGDAGDYYINITATSVNGLQSHGHNWSFTISEAYGPGLNSTPETTATVGEEYHYWVQGSVLITYTFSTNATFLSWSDESELISGTPGPDDVGVYWVNITATATDGGLMEWQNYTLTVGSLVSAPSSWAPEFSGPPEDAFTSIPYFHTFVANESVTWFWHYQIPGEWTVINDDSTLTLQGTPGAPGTYYFNLTATSWEGNLPHTENYTFVIVDTSGDDPSASLCASVVVIIAMGVLMLPMLAVNRRFR